MKWKDWESSTAQEVSISGKTVFKDGLHIRHDELVAAQGRVRRTILQDTEKRNSRHLSLDKIMNIYLESVRS